MYSAVTNCFVVQPSNGGGQRGRAHAPERMGAHGRTRSASAAENEKRLPWRGCCFRGGPSWGEPSSPFQFGDQDPTESRRRPTEVGGALRTVSCLLSRPRASLSTAHLHPCGTVLTNNAGLYHGAGPVAAGLCEPLRWLATEPSRDSAAYLRISRQGEAFKEHPVYNHLPAIITGPTYRRISRSHRSQGLL